MKKIEEIEKRMAEIKLELEKPDADLDALQKEVNDLNEQRSQLQKSAKEAEEKRRAIAAGMGSILDRHEETKPQTVDEIRGSQAYYDAYANYIKTGSMDECRALLTVNAPNNGSIPVPVILEEIVKTAWENNEILSRVNRTYIRGNLKVPFERSADDAYVHEEGTSAPTEEELLLGVVELIPKNVKKWVSISDEVMAMGGEAFLRYVFREVTYRVLRKLAALVVADIAGAGTDHTSSAVGIPKVNAAPGINTIPTAEAHLSDEAGKPVVIMNRLTDVKFRAAYAAGNFAVDPFDGLERVYTSALPAYDSASDNAVYAIVGDLFGAHVNYPEGDNVIIKLNDLSRAKEDISEVIGRQYAGHKVDRPGHFVNITKPAAATT